MISISRLDRQLALFLIRQRGAHTFVEFARATGIAASTLCRIENEEQSITLRKLDKLLVRLKKSVDDVFPAAQGGSKKSPACNGA